MIKSTLQEKEKKPPADYPYIGINHITNTLVLFKKKNTGTILYHKDKSMIGDHNDGWDETMFRVYTHIVCLKNMI